MLGSVLAHTVVSSIGVDTVWLFSDAQYHLDPLTVGLNGWPGWLVLAASVGILTTTGRSGRNAPPESLPRHQACRHSRQQQCRPRGRFLIPGIDAADSRMHSLRLLIYWWYDRCPARLGRGDRWDALTSAVHRCWVWLSFGVYPPVTVAGVWLQSASVCQLMPVVSLS